MGGTTVKVCRAIALEVGMESVLVGDAWTASVAAPWVDMAFNVCAADVYNASKVAAGWGVAAANGRQARIKIKIKAGKVNFIKLEFRMRASDNLPGY